MTLLLLGPLDHNQHSIAGLLWGRSEGSSPQEGINWDLVHYWRILYQRPTQSHLPGMGQTWLCPLQAWWKGGRHPPKPRCPRAVVREERSQAGQLLCGTAALPTWAEVSVRASAAEPCRGTGSSTVAIRSRCWFTQGRRGQLAGVGGALEKQVWEPWRCSSAMGTGRQQASEWAGDVVGYEVGNHPLRQQDDLLEEEEAVERGVFQAGGRGGT